MNRRKKIFQKLKKKDKKANEKLHSNVPNIFLRLSANKKLNNQRMIICDCCLVIAPVRFFLRENSALSSCLR